MKELHSGPICSTNRGIWQRDEGKIKESLHATVHGYVLATLEYGVKVQPPLSGRF